MTVPVTHHFKLQILHFVNEFIITARCFYRGKQIFIFLELFYRIIEEFNSIVNMAFNLSNAEKAEANIE